jgi:hypothetical protein
MTPSTPRLSGASPRRIDARSNTLAVELAKRRDHRYVAPPELDTFYGVGSHSTRT